MKKLNFLIAFTLLGTMLVKGQTTDQALKISITKLTAHEKDNRIYVEWAANAGTESNYWEIQGSADGKNFSTVALVLGTDPGKTGEQYTFKGKITRSNDLYYRVVHISLTGNDHQKSDIIQVVKQDSLSATTPQQ